MSGNNSSSFPTSLSELHFPSTQNLSHILSDLRRSTLSITNRLKSIETDSLFVQEVSDSYGFPLVANERCGSWYIPPEKKAGSAYFKSTDGHTGQWSFSSRRLNLQIFDIVSQYGGCIVVDSTRRGKSMPDALSKTVPIWSAVINRSLFPDIPAYHNVQFPPDFLGASEESQIEDKIDEFVMLFKDLKMDLEELKARIGKPIQLAWATRDYFWPNYQDDHPDFHLLVLCSASKRVHGAEMSEGGYIQGAGDDSEGWAHGLTAPIFWKYKTSLLSSGEEGLPTLINELIDKERRLPSLNEATLVKPTGNIYIGKNTGISNVASSFDLVIDCNGNVDSCENPRVLNMGCTSGKLGGRQLRRFLGKARDFISLHLTRDPAKSVIVTCEDGKDLSVGTALMIICLFYDDSGAYQGLRPGTYFNKQSIRQRLAWIVSSKHDINPSRSTLQSVNSYLMENPDDR